MTKKSARFVFCFTTITISALSLVFVLSRQWEHWQDAQDVDDTHIVHNSKRMNIADPSDDLGRQAYAESIRNTHGDFGGAVPVYPKYTPAMFREIGDDKYQIVFHADGEKINTGKIERKNIAVMLRMDAFSHKIVYVSDELEYGRLLTAVGSSEIP